MMIAGKELKITPASFQEARTLERAVGQALMANRVSLDLDSKMTMETKITPETMGSFLQMIVSIGISGDVEKALFDCARRATFDGKKVDYDFFEVVENREHFYPIMIEILKVNIFPFFKSLFSGSGWASGLIENFLKQK